MKLISTALSSLALVSGSDHFDDDTPSLLQLRSVHEASSELGHSYTYNSSHKISGGDFGCTGRMSTPATKKCGLWGDVHQHMKFQGGGHSNSNGLGWFWLARSNDDEFQAQGFYRPVNQNDPMRGWTTLSHFVFKFGRQILFLDRDLQSDPTDGRSESWLWKYYFRDCDAQPGELCPNSVPVEAPINNPGCTGPGAADQLPCEIGGVFWANRGVGGSMANQGNFGDFAHRAAIRNSCFEFLQERVAIWVSYQTWQRNELGPYGGGGVIEIEGASDYLRDFGQCAADQQPVDPTEMLVTPEQNAKICSDNGLPDHMCDTPVLVAPSDGWTHYHLKQCYQGNNNNPIFGGGGFEGQFSLDECKQRCLAATDNQGRPCAAIEWSCNNADQNCATANCAFAWGCDDTSHGWGGGGIYVPPAPAEPTAEELCATAAQGGIHWNPGEPNPKWEHAQELCADQQMHSNDIYQSCLYDVCASHDAAAEQLAVGGAELEASMANPIPLCKVRPNTADEMTNCRPCNICSAATVVDLTNIVQNNLGGVGPDSGAEEIRYKNAINLDGQLVDVVLTADSNYALIANKASRNGENGKRPEPFGRFLINSGITSDMRFEFQDASTGAPVAVPDITVTFYDMDEAEQQYGVPGTRVQRETITMCNAHEVYVTQGTELVDEPVEGQCRGYTSSVVGTGADNPKQPATLTMAQARRSVTYQFTRRAHIDWTARVTSGANTPRPILWSFRPQVACGASDSDTQCADWTPPWDFHPLTQCYQNGNNNPIFGGGGFIGQLSLEDCKAACSNDAACAAIEWSCNNADQSCSTANCALAWGCDDTSNGWGGGGVYINPTPATPWTHHHLKQCYQGGNNNPIFGGGGFIGSLSLTDCQERCLVDSDSQGRQCVAIEWSCNNAAQSCSTANCALAWGCDDTSHSWGGGGIYTRPQAVLATLHWNGGSTDLTDEVTCVSGSKQIENELGVPNDRMTGISNLRPGCEVKLFEHSRHCRPSADAEDNCSDQRCLTLSADTMDLTTLSGKVSGLTLVCN